MLSRWPQGANDDVHAIPQIKLAISELNPLMKETGDLIYMPGNHCERWDKYVFGATPHVLKGALGLKVCPRL
jgi:hypothetical protein